MNKLKMRNLVGFVVMLFTLNSMTAQIVNEGVLKIERNTKVYFAEDYTNEGTHTNEGSLTLEANFINNGTTTESGDADNAEAGNIFTAGTTHYITGTTKKVVFENILAFGNVSVEDATELLVENGVLLFGGDLRMVGESQLIQKHTGIPNVSGDNKLLIDQQGTTNPYSYNHWSSPVQGATAGAFSVGEILYDGTDAALNSFTPQIVTYIDGSGTADGGGWEGSPAVIDGTGAVTTASELVNYWIWTYSGVATSDVFSSTSEWALQREDGVINVGLGYTMKGNNASGSTQNWVFKGTPNDGDIFVTIGTGQNVLTGNPYPSALDADTFINANYSDSGDSVTTGVLYFWSDGNADTHWADQYQGGYATYSLAGGVAAAAVDAGLGSASTIAPNSPYKIPVGQGFFVESGTGAGDGGTIVFNNTMRVFKTDSSDADSNFFRQAQIQRIRLKYKSPENNYRPLMAAFIAGTTDGHDLAYDAKMYDLFDEDSYFGTSDNPFVIDARPFDMDAQIPLGIKVVHDGMHTITLEKLENFNENVYILDTETGYTHDIRQGDFEVNLTEGVYDNRFKLVFRAASPAGNEEVILSSMNVYYAPDSKNLVIDNFDKLTIKSAKVYNAIGQVIKVISKSDLEQNKIVVPFDVATGAYFITVDTTIGKADFKVAAY